MKSSRSKWYQFGLRTLLLLVAASAVVTYLSLPYLRIQFATARIQALGGSTRDGNMLLDSELWSVDLYGTNLDDEGLKELVPYLQHIDKLELLVECPRVGDEGVAALAQLTEIRSLFLPGTGLTDNALADVSRMKKLRFLGLSGTSITDKGLHHLQELKELEKLFLGGTNVTSQGIRQLQRALPDLYIEY